MVHGILDDIIVYYGILWCIMVVVYARTRAHTWTKEVCQLHTPFKTRAQTPAPVNSGVTSVQGQLKTSIRLHIAVRASKLEPSILKYCWVPLPQTLRHALPAPAWPKPARKAGHAKQMRRRVADRYHRTRLVQRASQQSLLQRCLAAGPEDGDGHVALKRNWSKGKFRQFLDSGEPW